MANDKQAEARAELLDADHSLDTTSSMAEQPHSGQTEAAVESWGTRFMKGLSHNLHYVTFMPLILIGVLSSVNLLLAAAVCTGLVACIIVLSYCCFRRGYVKVFPKPFDIFNLCLYGSMIFLAAFAHDWLATYMSLLTNAGNAAFMWATILLPCCDNFVMHTVRDRIPLPVVSGALVKRMALLIALLWASALTIMTSGAAIPIALKNNPQLIPAGGIHAIKIVVPVLSFGPLLLAVALQFVITHVYRKKIAQHYKQLQEQQAAGAAGAVRHNSDQQGPRKGDDAV